MRRELIDCVNVIVGFVIGAREEANSAFNQIKLIAVGVHFGRIKNRVSEFVDESVVGVVGFGAVDNNGLEILIPRLRMAEELAQSAFADDRIGSEAIDELFGDVFVNVVGVRMAEIILKRRPDVIAKLFFKFFHEWIPPKIVKALSFKAQG